MSVDVFNRKSILFHGCCFDFTVEDQRIFFFLNQRRCLECWLFSLQELLTDLLKRTLSFDVEEFKGFFPFYFTLSLPYCSIYSE